MDWFLYDRNLRHERVKSTKLKKKFPRPKIINKKRHWLQVSANKLNVKWIFWTKLANKGLNDKK